MSTAEEKDPPVPADLEGAAQRVHRKQAPASGNSHDDEVLDNEPDNEPGDWKGKQAPAPEVGH